jgi:hypothetical protein
MRDPKDITINGKQLSEILEAHLKWLYNNNEEGDKCADLSRANLYGANLSRANLSRANLYGANLSSADLSRADLSSADLYGANLSRANLSRADLYGANLSRADLYGANLSSANLSRANLSSADLYGANLSSADLSSADLYGANLSRADLSSADLYGAKNIEWADAVTRIIPDGDIIGWKKCNEGIVKLLIPAKAKRSNATGRKCRAEYAVDKGHFTFNGKLTKKNFTSTFDGDFVYEVGATIKPNSWDENRWAECSSGVHFFITRFEAENYDS